MWKMFMAKTQQINLLVENDVFKQNHDPGVGDSTGIRSDVHVLRDVWDGLNQYALLWFDGSIREGLGQNHYVLSSPHEALIYCSSETQDTLAVFEPHPVYVDSLMLADGKYTAYCISPADSILKSEVIDVHDGSIMLLAPRFIDDIAFLIQRR